VLWEESFVAALSVDAEKDFSSSEGAASSSLGYLQLATATRI
jgi:hypothetical protein